MKKRGQITIFVIVAILVIIVSFIIFFLSSKSTTDIVEDTSPFEVASIEMFVDSCFKKTVKESVIEIGGNGGYFRFNQTIPNFHLKPYYFYENQVLVPSLELIENQMELYIETHLPYCTDQFKTFSEYEIKSSPVKADAKILPEKVIVKIDYPLEITQNNKTTELNKFENEQNTRLGIIHSFLEEYFNNHQINEPEGVIISEFNKFSEETFYYYVVDTYAPDFTFVIIDNETTVDNQDFYFEFAARYQLIEVEPWVE